MYATARGRRGHWTLLVVSGVGFSFAVGPAIFGVQHWNVGGIGGFVGAAFSTRMRNRSTTSPANGWCRP